MHADNPCVEGMRVQPSFPLTASEADLLARRYVAAYNDRDLEAMLALCDENVVSHPAALFERRPNVIGHDGMREWWQSMVVSGRWYDVVVNEVRQLEPDRWAILGEICDHGEPVSPWVVLFRTQNGLIIESQSYLSDPELLDGLGLLDKGRQSR